MADRGGDGSHDAGWEQLSAVMGADRSADVRAAGLAWLWVADAVEAQLVVLEQGRRELVPRWRSAAGEEFLARLGETARALRDTAAVARHNHRVMDAAADDLSRAQRDFAAVAAAALPGAERDEAGRAIVRALDGRYEQAIAEFREVPLPPGASGAVPSGLSRGSGGLLGGHSIAGPTGSPNLAASLPGSAAPSGSTPPRGVRPSVVPPGVIPPGMVPPERTGPGPILGGAPAPRPTPGRAPGPLPGSVGDDPDTVGPIGGPPVGGAPIGGMPVGGAPVGGAPDGGASATTGRRTGPGVVPGVGVGPPVPGARPPAPPAARGPVAPGAGAGSSPGAGVTPAPAVPGGAAPPWTSPSSSARPRATDAPRPGHIQPAPTPNPPASAPSAATPRPPASARPHRVEATTTRYVDGQGNRITIRRSAGDSRIGSVGGAPATAQRAESRDTGGAAGGA
jgi:hypothetical protein